MLGNTNLHCMMTAKDIQIQQHARDLGSPLGEILVRRLLPLASRHFASRRLAEYRRNRLGAHNISTSVETDANIVHPSLESPASHIGPDMCADKIQNEDQAQQQSRDEIAWVHIDRLKWAKNISFGNMATVSEEDSRYWAEFAGGILASGLSADAGSFRPRTPSATTICPTRGSLSSSCTSAP